MCVCVCVYGGGGGGGVIGRGGKGYGRARRMQLMLYHTIQNISTTYGCLATTNTPWGFTPYTPDSVRAGVPEDHDDTEDKDKEHVPVAVTQP